MAKTPKKPPKEKAARKSPAKKMSKAVAALKPMASKRRATPSAILPATGPGALMAAAVARQVDAATEDQGVARRPSGGTVAATATKGITVAGTPTISGLDLSLDLVPVTPGNLGPETLVAVGRVPIEGVPIVPVSMRPGARHVRLQSPINSYVVTINGGLAREPEDGTLVRAAANSPYVGVSIGEGGITLEAVEPAAILLDAYFVCRDGLEGRVETQAFGNQYRIFVGQPAAHFEMLHRLMRTERPVMARIGVWYDGAEIELTSCDLYARLQTVGQRKD